jgi:Dyp-type peroxidase family
MRSLQLEDIQGLVLRSYTGEPYNLKVARFLFINIEEREAGGTWLSKIARDIMSVSSLHSTLKTCINLAFTYSGLKALGLPLQILESFPLDFQEGMHQRSRILGDDFQSAPSHWDKHFGDELHVVLLIYASDQTVLESEANRQLSFMDLSKLKITGQQDAAKLPGGIEHFGFSDGSSQPVVEGDSIVAQPGQDIIKPGEFILGYPDQDGVIQNLIPSEIGTNSTFLVYRKLYQDVALFRSYLNKVASDSDPPFNNSKLLAAKIVGRWQSGAPLVLSPDQEDEALGNDPTRNNDFNYLVEDPKGFKCPLGSHIRRVNPRDALLKDDPTGSKSQVNKHRIIRRGIAYGPLLPAGIQQDDAIDRGLIFISVQSNISRQFEFIQREWMNNLIFNGLSRDKDPISGNSNKDADMTIQRSPVSKKLRNLPRFTLTKGGSYLFLPGLKAYSKIVEYATSAS